MNDGRIFVAEITVVVDDIGTEQTFYFSTSHFTTKPSDTPANKPISAYLKNPGTYKADLFSKGRVTGLVQPNYGVMILANPLDSTGKGVFDDWANYGVSNGKVILRMGYETDAYPSAWTTVYIARVYKLTVTEDVNITLRDRSNLFDRPVNSSVFLGTGGMEGNGTGLGRKKQNVFGDPGFHPAICINAQKQIYYVSGNGCDYWSADNGLLSPYNGSQDYISGFDVFDNAYKLLRTNNYSTFEELESTVPDEGEVRFWFGGTSSYSPLWYKGPIYFRLGSPPAGEIRIFGIGYPSEKDNDNMGFLFGSIFLETLAFRIGLTSSDVQDISQWKIVAGAQLVDEDQTYLQVMSDACLQYNGWFGFNRQDVFVSGYVLDPKNDGSIYYGIKIPEFPDGLPGVNVEDTVSKFTFTDDYIKNLRSDPVSGQENAMWAAVFNTGRTWPVSNIAGGASDKNRDWMTRQPYYDSFKAYSDTTKIKHPNAETIEVYIPSRAIQNNFSRHLYSARFMWLYAGTPRTYTFTTDLLPELLSIELNDVVKLQTARFGLSAGVKMRVIGMTINTQSREIEWTLWINGRGIWTGSTSPLDPGTDAYDENNKTKKLINKIGKVYWPEWKIYSAGGLGISAGTGGAFIQIPEWDLIATGTMPRVDPLASYVLALLRADGIDGDSGAFINESDVKHTQTFTTATKYETDYYKFGLSSFKRDLTNSNIGNFDINIDGTENLSSSTTRKFTIEGWVRVITPEDGFDTTLMRLEYYNTTTFVEHFSINYVRTSGVNHLTFDRSTAGTDIDATIDSSIESKFCHVAADWDGSNIRLYLDGSVIGTFAYTSHGTANRFRLKIFNGSSGNDNDIRIDGIRLTADPTTANGCRYAGAFTPPNQDWPRINDYNFAVATTGVGTITNNKTNWTLVITTGAPGNSPGGRSGVITGGKRYCEFKVSQKDSALMFIGLGIGVRDDYAFIGGHNYAIFQGTAGCGLGNAGYSANGSFTTNSSYSYAVNDIIGVAFDTVSGKIWFSKNGTWISGDPATGSSPTATVSDLTKQYYFCASCYTCGSPTGTYIVNIYEKASNQTYASPSGFLPLLSPDIA